jgi:hypothetical protein
MSTGLQPSHSAPKIWKYVLGATFALAIMVPLWITFDVLMLRSDALDQPETAMTRIWWFGVPVIAVVLMFGIRWTVADHQAQERQKQLDIQTIKAQQQLAADRTEQGRREYVLEVIGLGVTLDKYRQGKLWEVLKNGGAYTTIRETDPKKYPWGDVEKLQMMGGRGGDALENAANFTVLEWGVPVFNAEPPSHNARRADSPLLPDAGLAAGAESSGMGGHLFVVGPRRFEERPDRILEDIFNFFDANPDIPYVVFNSDDGMSVRDAGLPIGAPPLVKEGYYIPAMPDSATVFLLARRERVDTVRPFVFEDISYEEKVEKLNRDGIARRLFLAYLNLKNSVPLPPNAKADGFAMQRQPLISEWLPEAAKFAVRPDIRGTGPISPLDREWWMKNRPPLDWKPTPWFPVPWSTIQLEEFDRLPTLGFIHRPVFVKMTDEHGKALGRRDTREAALLAGWQESLKTLPESERSKGPARVIAATNGQKEQLLALEGVLHRYAEQGGPEIDTGRVDQFTNIDHRLGNTGAATLFMGMAIGVMGSYREGGASAAINLRDPHEASIIFITPPSDEKRKNQQHARGGDVFRSVTQPAIDPANYAPPEAVPAKP